MRNFRRLLTGLLIIVTLGGGVLLGIWGSGAFPGLSPFGAAASSSSTQIIHSLTKEEQVVLLSLGIQGIDRQDKDGKLFGVSVPGSERSSLVQYSFTAKLGIEGKDVTVAQTGEKLYLVSIPEFIFIGHDNATFESAIESNGALSWVTPAIDPLELVNRILSEEKEREYLSSHDEILKEQAKSFYSGIIASIDPEAVVEFEYR